MEIIIERIENEIVVVELPSKELINVPKKLFGNVKENDVVNITIDKKKTNERKEKITELINQVFED